MCTQNYGNVFKWVYDETSLRALSPLLIEFIGTTITYTPIFQPKWQQKWLGFVALSCMADNVACFLNIHHRLTYIIHQETYSYIYKLNLCLLSF